MSKFKHKDDNLASLRAPTRPYANQSAAADARLFNPRGARVWKQYNLNPAFVQWCEKTPRFCHETSTELHDFAVPWYGLGVKKILLGPQI